MLYTAFLPREIAKRYPTRCPLCLKTHQPPSNPSFKNHTALFQNPLTLKSIILKYVILKFLILKAIHKHIRMYLYLCTKLPRLICIRLK